MPQDLTEFVLKRLKALRVKHGLTQEQFSEISGIAYKYYQQLEAGRKRDFRLSTLERVAKAYQIAVYQLLDPREPKTRPFPTRGTAGKPGSRSRGSPIR